MKWRNAIVAAAVTGVAGLGVGEVYLRLKDRSSSQTLQPTQPAAGSGAAGSGGDPRQGSDGKPLDGTGTEAEVRAAERIRRPEEEELFSVTITPVRSTRSAMGSTMNLDITLKNPKSEQLDTAISSRLVDDRGREVAPVKTSQRGRTPAKASAKQNLDTPPVSKDGYYMFLVTAAGAATDASKSEVSAVQAAFFRHEAGALSQIDAVEFYSQSNALKAEVRAK